MNHPRTLPLLVLGIAMATSAASQDAAPTPPATQATSATPAPAPAPAPRNRSEAAAAWTADGLAKVDIRGIDVAYARPGASLAGYDQVLLRPASIAFRRGWERGDGTRRKIRPEDAQLIRDRLTAVLIQEIGKELVAGGYVLSEKPGEKVLELELRITDLYIAAPDIRTTANKDVYAVSAGEMTLVAELRDSASGETLMRLYDNEEGDKYNTMHRITDAENESEARTVVGGWARALRTQLDLAKAGPQG
jgi:hypothetical protein